MRTVKRLLSLALLLAVLLSMAACDRTPAPSSSAPAPPPSSSSEPEIIEIPMANITFQGEKIEAGAKRNADTVGWLKIENTDPAVDDAVLQYSDNDYYLRLNEDKEYYEYGCYYLDYECAVGTREELSQQTIIYGHSSYQDSPTASDNYGTGLKFSQLYRYMDIDFLRNNPYIYFSTSDEDMTWKIFAVCYTNIDLGYNYANFSGAQFADMINEYKLRSEYIIDQNLSTNDKLLILSTCTGSPDRATGGEQYKNYRMLVVARLVPVNEETPATMEVKPNPDPKRS